MIKVENVEVYNIARAVYSARNALNSWDKSDSDLKKDTLGPVDLDLAKRLYKSGSEHRKFLRQIFVTMDITAPIYLKWIHIKLEPLVIVVLSCTRDYLSHLNFRISQDMLRKKRCRYFTNLMR